MKKLIAYILVFVACAWLINYAVKLILEVWQVIVFGIVAALVGWIAFQTIKHKDWR